MPCRFASSGTVATSRSASRAILALNAASNFLRDLVISVLHPLRQSRTPHTLTFGPISGVHFNTRCGNNRPPNRQHKPVAAWFIDPQRGVFGIYLFRAVRDGHDRAAKDPIS